MVDRPSPAGELISLSLREGAWLALLGCICMAVGAMWTRRAPAVRTAATGRRRVVGAVRLDARDLSPAARSPTLVEDLLRARAPPRAGC